MRKILTFTRFGIATAAAVARRAAKTTVGFSLAVTFCCSSQAFAQTVARTLAPTATSGHPVSFASWQAQSNGTVNNLNDNQAVNAAYSVLSDSTNVQPASYFDRGQHGLAADVCNPGCDVSYYVNYEALWLRREGDERFSLSRNSFMEDFEYEFGGRYTIGSLSNCVDGWEATYVGPFDWQRRGSVIGAGNLQSNFLPVDGFTGAQITAFNDADQHAQAYRAQLNSFELNRRWWTWDVLSTMVGVRYIDYEEDYSFLSSRSGVGVGEFTQSVDNQMVGLQVGGDILYPVNMRTNVGFRAKGGVYANFYEGSRFMSNAGTLILNSGDSDVDVAGLIEGGIFTQYSIVDSIRLTAGYEFWFMPGMATIAEQQPNRVGPGSGSTVQREDDVFLHGGHVGVQVLF